MCDNANQNLFLTLCNPSYLYFKHHQNTCSQISFQIFHDFGLKFTLGMSLQHLGEMFLAACDSQDGQFLAELGGHPFIVSSNLRASALSIAVNANRNDSMPRAQTSTSQSSTYVSKMKPIAFTTTHTGTGSLGNIGHRSNDKYNDSEEENEENAPTGRDRMYFEGFLDVLVRSAMVGLRPMGKQAEASSAAASAPVLVNEDGSKSQLLEAGIAAKVLFQSLSRQLNKSSVMKILSKRKSTCAYPAGLMKGTMSLNAKYLAMWKRDGRVDYLLDGPVLADRILRQPSVLKPRERQHRQQAFQSATSSLSTLSPKKSLLTPKVRTKQKDNRQMSRSAFAPKAITNAGSSSLRASTVQMTHTTQSGRALLARLLERSSETSMSDSGDTRERKELSGDLQEARSYEYETNAIDDNRGLDFDNQESSRTAKPHSSSHNTRERSLSGSLTPRTMTPQVWGGSGETRSPSFRPNMLISKKQDAWNGRREHLNSENREGVKTSVPLSSSSSSSFPKSSLSKVSLSTLTGFNGQTAAAAVARYEKLTKASVDLRRIINPSGQSQNSSSGSNDSGVLTQVGRAVTPDRTSWNSDKAATFSGQSSKSDSSSSDSPPNSLSQSMPASSLQNTRNTSSSDSSRSRTKDTDGKNVKSYINAAILIQKKVKQLQNAQDLNLDEQLRKLEEHEQLAKEEDTRLELQRQKEEQLRREKEKEEEERERGIHFERRLTRGHLFYKHGRNRRAERRFVYVTPNLQTIAWRHVTSKIDSKSGKAFSSKNLKWVSAGLENERTKPVQSNEYCLTLHMQSRTIQLECDNEYLRNEWLEAFRWLINSWRMGPPTPRISNLDRSYFKE